MCVSPRSISRSPKTAGLEHREAKTRDSIGRQLDSNFIGSNEANGRLLGTGVGAREESNLAVSFRKRHIPRKSLSSTPR